MVTTEEMVQRARDDAEGLIISSAKSETGNLWSDVTPAPDTNRQNLEGNVISRLLNNIKKNLNRR